MKKVFKVLLPVGLLAVVNMRAYVFTNESRNPVEVSGKKVFRGATRANLPPMKIEPRQEKGTEIELTEITIKDLATGKTLKYLKSKNEREFGRSFLSIKSGPELFAKEGRDSFQLTAE